jgi:hypothetical protein
MKERYIEYCGMNYEQASREAERLINKDGWYKSFDRLGRLRVIMELHLLKEKA